MYGAPAAMQPTEAIQVSWADREIGAVTEVGVKALHDGDYLFFHLEWADESANTDHGDNTSFPDGAAVSLPLAEQTPLVTMGSPEKGMNAWYWRADAPDSGRNVVSGGLGTSETLDLDLVRCRSLWNEGRWQVVIARALRVDSEGSIVQLEAGGKTQFGVAVWEGSKGERGGIKSFSGNWIELILAERA
jgi:DMSO reductase family type II enzyme heme b subunit